jgi:hypothetical protein
MSVIGSALPFFFGASKSGVPAIGAAYQGGFFAGLISHTANGVATHALIVAPAATGATGGDYTPLTTSKEWKTSYSLTAGTTSDFNGAANTAAMVTAGIALHPAAQFCTGLSIGGYTDWYLPARYELDIAYQNLKPTTASNDTSFGINAYSVPARASNRTAGAPAQTTVAAFQSGGAEAFLTSNGHWSSTEYSATNAWVLLFGDGYFSTSTKSYAYDLVRAFRKVAL